MFSVASSKDAVEDGVEHCPCAKVFQWLPRPPVDTRFSSFADVIEGIFHVPDVAVDAAVHVRSFVSPDGGVDHLGWILQDEVEHVPVHLLLNLVKIKILLFGEFFVVIGVHENG